MADPITIAALVVATAAFLAKRGSADGDGDGSDGNPLGGNVATQTTIADGIYPLPTLGTRPAVISDGFSAEKTDEHRQHLGADIMYRRLAHEPQTLPTGSRLFSVPANTPVLAALPGKIWSAKLTDLGHSVVIDHGNVAGIGPLCTFYQHMSRWSRAWKKGDAVAAGDELGIVGHSLVGYGLDHLHFEMWNPTRDKAIDPAPFLSRWKRKVK